MTDTTTTDTTTDAGGAPGPFDLLLDPSFSANPQPVHRRLREQCPVADEIDFERAENRHWAFGGGIHRCLGSHLARRELRVALRERHRRIPAYHIPDGAQLQWAPLLRQVEHLPLVFDDIRG